MIATILKTRYHIAGKLGDGGIPAYERVCIFEDLGALFAGRKPAKASKVYARALAIFEPLGARRSASRIGKATAQQMGRT